MEVLSQAVMTSSHVLASREMMLKVATPEKEMQSVVLGWKGEDDLMHTIVI